MIYQISVCRWKRFDTYSFPSCPFSVERIPGRSHVFRRYEGNLASTILHLFVMHALHRNEVSAEYQMEGKTACANAQMPPNPILQNKLHLSHALNKVALFPVVTTVLHWAL